MFKLVFKNRGFQLSGTKYSVYICHGTCTKSVSMYSL